MSDHIVRTVIEYEDKPPCKTAEEMTELCCKETAALLCCEKKEIWNGYSKGDVLENLGIELDDQGRDANGHYVVIEFLPRDRPCGIQVTEYDLSGKNCCDEVTELAWDDAGSADVVATGSQVLVGFIGGKLPAVVKVRGQGFTLDGYSLRDAIVNGRKFYIHANEYACGVCTITFNDGCTVAKGEVRATRGKWYRVYNHSGGINGGNPGNTPPIGPFPGGCPASFYSPGSWGTKEGISGKYKVVQGYSNGHDIYNTARDTMAEVLALCQVRKARYPGDYRATGGCFYEDPGHCSVCGSCGVSAEIMSGDVGFHSKVGPYLDTYLIGTRWVTCYSTNIYEWRC